MVLCPTVDVTLSVLRVILRTNWYQFWPCITRGLLNATLEFALYKDPYYIHTYIHTNRGVYDQLR